jgi:hypothetical protein
VRGEQAGGGSGGGPGTKHVHLRHTRHNQVINQVICTLGFLTP